MYIYRHIFARKILLTNNSGVSKIRHVWGRRKITLGAMVHCYCDLCSFTWYTYIHIIPLYIYITHIYIYIYIYMYNVIYEIIYIYGLLTTYDFPQMH